MNRLDGRVILEEPLLRRTELGDEVKSWRLFGTFWANVRHLNGKEYSIGNIDAATAKSSVRIRLNRAVTVDMRLIHRGEIYRIEAVLHDETRRKYTDLVCTKGEDG